MIPLFGIGLQGKSPVVTSQYRLNLYYEFQRDVDRTKVAVYGTPGTVLKLNLGETGIRQIYELGDYYYVVHRGNFYQVDNTDTATLKGMLTTSTGKVDIRDNGTQIIITDETNGYIYSLTYDTFFTIEQVSTGTTDGTTASKLVDSGADFVTDGVKAGMIVYNTTDSTKTTITAVDSATQLSVAEDIFITGENYEIGPDGFLAPNSMEFMDTYFVGQGAGNLFQISASGNGADWNALEFSYANNSPDDLVRVYENNSELILFCEKTTEFHINTSAVDFPFQRVAKTDWGLAAKWSVAKFDNSVMFLALNSEMGEVILARLDGHNPVRVSSHDWENIINEYTDIASATAYSYMIDGHPMYRIHFTNSSWEYDGSTGLISEIRSEGHTRHISNVYAYYNNQHLVGDYSTGRVYKLDKDTYTDNGQIIRRKIRGKHIFDDQDNKIIIDRVQLLMETGVGTVSGQGSNPMALLQASKDGGRNYGYERWAPIGQIGETKSRVKYTRLGAARDWVIEWTITDPIKVAVTGVNMRYRTGSS